MGYSHLFGSQFPEQPLSITEKFDIDDSVVGTVNEIENYLKTGNMESAAALLSENKDTLDKYLIDSDFINLLQEEIYNVGLLAISQQNTIISSLMPDTQTATGSYWIQDF